MRYDRDAGLTPGGDHDRFMAIEAADMRYQSLRARRPFFLENVNHARAQYEAARPVPARRPRLERLHRTLFWY